MPPAWTCLHPPLSARPEPTHRLLQDRQPVVLLVAANSPRGGATSSGVGVIADEKVDGLDDTVSGGMYVSNAQSPTNRVSLLVRAGLDPRNLERAVRDALADVDPDQALSEVRTLQQIQSESVFGERFLAAAGLVIGVVGALVLARVMSSFDLGRSPGQFG